MENRSHALIAGFFAIVLAAGVVAAAMWLNRDTQARTTYILTTVGSVAGLNPQAAVRYRGMEVGKVEAIEFDRDKPGQILVRIGVTPSTPMTTATFAELGMQGLTGLAYVQLDVDEKVKGAQPLASLAEEPARLPIRPSMFDRFSLSGEDVLLRASTAMDQVNKLLADDKQALLVQTLVNLQAVSTRVGDLIGELRPAVKGAVGLVDDGRKTLKNTDEALASVARLSTEIARKLDQVDRMAASAETVSRAATDIGRAATDAGRAATAITNETVPRLSLLIDDARLGLRSVDATARSFERTADRISEEPTSVLFGIEAPRPGPGEPGFVAPGAAR